MSKLKVFRRKYLDELKRIKNYNWYFNDEELCFPDDAILESSHTEIADLPPELEPSVNSDIDNAIKIYEYLTLDETQASDERLWAYLTHVTFREYTQQRWPMKEKTDEKKICNYIREHWFMDGSSRSLRRNAISRLWWPAHMTYAPWEKSEYFRSIKNEDRYVYTKIVLANQDIAQQLMERKLSWSDHLLIAILELFRRDNTFLDNRKLTRELIKEINLILGYRRIMMLDFDQLMSELSGVAQYIKDENSKVLNSE